MTPLDAFPAALQGWQNFYLLTGTAAATLIGLMFVAVTFGASLVTKETAQSARAFLDPTFIHFAQVLLTACVLTIPTLGPVFLGALLVIMGVFRVLGLYYVLGHYRRAHREHGDIELSDWLASILAPLVCHLLAITTGVGFIAHVALALTGLAVLTVGLLAIGIYGAWELLVWMALAVGESRRRPPG
jgi:hypothetical protein